MNVACIFLMISVAVSNVFFRGLFIVDQDFVIIVKRIIFFTKEYEKRESTTYMYVVAR